VRGLDPVHPEPVTASRSHPDLRYDEPPILPVWNQLPTRLIDCRASPVCRSSAGHSTASSWWSPFNELGGSLKDHAVTVFYSLTTPSAATRSYTTFVSRPLPECRTLEGAGKGSRECRTTNPYGASRFRRSARSGNGSDLQVSGDAARSRPDRNLQRRTDQPDSRRGSVGRLWIRHWLPTDSDFGWNDMRPLRIATRLS
jgi:hypothetical protein